MHLQIMNKQQIAISVSHVSLSYGSQQILYDVNIDIPKHAIMAVIGPNGSGKTTFIKILLGLIEPNKGNVKVFGAEPKKARSRIAYVPQRFSFDQTMPITVMEFLVLSAVNVKKEDIEDAMKHFKITHLQKVALGTLSGGQLQRVLLARAFMQHPDILYLDEPEAGVDIGGEHDFYDLIKHLHDEHDMTIIFVSHEVDIVSQYATHVLCLNQQHICFGDPKSMLDTKTLSELYGTDIELFSHKHKKS
ncbi:MAG TPA: metal ABC transporter ATP-binding protein [Candidatus Pacebacteria bacterium]|nr:metal ABC transporter ATP-binding protein [Candidatus Paceibacterota bacterium]